MTGIRGLRIKHGGQQRCEKKFVEFVEANPPIGGLNERTLRPLIDETDTEVRVTAIDSIEKSLESGKNPTNDRCVLSHRAMGVVA